MKGYGVEDFDDLEEAKRFCDDVRTRYRRLRVIDLLQNKGRGETIPILYEVP